MFRGRGSGYRRKTHLAKKLWNFLVIEEYTFKLNLCINLRRNVKGEAVSKI
jgi:hypothetical protein